MSSKYTAEGSVWINEGGRIVCRDHGGNYLATAINAGEGPHIFTSLDDWLYHPPEIAEEYDLNCEDCGGRTTRHDGGRVKSVRAPLEFSITNGG